MTQFLPSVPQTWWPGTRDEPVEETKQTEPSVTANVAVIADSDKTPTHKEMPAAGKTLVPLKRDRVGRASPANATVTAQSGGRVSSAPTEDEQQAAAREVAEAAAINQGRRDGGDDQLERLKAALNDDARRNTEPNRMASLSGDARLRVDSLLSRAKRLFDVDRLSEARQTAQIAQELGETARLDYSPDEERPIDLVHRIDDQLQAMQQPSDEAGAETNDVANADRSKAEESPAAELKTAATESTGNRSWLGRGMNVFRRDRKPSATDAMIIPAAADNTPSQVSLSLELDDEAGTNTDSRAAVVQANRSVALSTVISSQSADREPVRPQAIDRNAGDESSRSNQSSVEADSVVSEFPGVGRSADGDISDRSLDDPATFPADGGPQLTTDDSATTLPALEDVRPVSPFRNVAGQTKASRPSSPEHVESHDMIWGWGVGTACLLACSLLALTCYRRGAT